MRTHPVDKLLEQHCYKSAAGLLQLVRFYLCNVCVYVLNAIQFTRIRNLKLNACMVPLFHSMITLSEQW
jgi:hypothetical protein